MFVKLITIIPPRSRGKRTHAHANATRKRAHTHWYVRASTGWLARTHEMWRNARRRYALIRCRRRPISRFPLMAERLFLHFNFRWPLPPGSFPPWVTTAHTTVLRYWRPPSPCCNCLIKQLRGGDKSVYLGRRPK